MTELEIAAGIKLLCETSAQVNSYYENDQNIVQALNNADENDLRKCAEYYSTRTGVVVDIRKELIDRLINNEIFTVESLHALIKKYKEGKENQFRSYKETFSIVFPAITFYGHNPQRDFVKSFTQKLVEDLGLTSEIKEVSFDFQGVRQQGSDQYWVAIFNKKQENQTKAIQFFFGFQKGKIGYAVYKHEDLENLKPRKTFLPQEFNYQEMLSYFDSSKKILLEDIPKNENSFAISIDAKVIYAYLKKSYSHRKIQSEILDEDAPARGGGFLAMQILHKYEIEGNRKGILNSVSFNEEYNKSDGKYLEALDLLRKYYPEFVVEQEKTTDMTFSLNTILYGPPGTGKTYNTVIRAAEIIEKRIIESYGEALEIFRANLHDRIEFITFHQNYSYEDFIQGLRPETDNSSSLLFEKKDGVFKKIADKALENLILSQKAPEDLSREALFKKALENFSDSVLESEENTPINNTAYIFEVEDDAFRYTGKKWINHANGLRMKFSDLKEFYRNGVKSRKDIKNLKTISGLANQHATYYFLVYDQILKYLPTKVDRPERIEQQNYVIIIDEINRANISRVFGELITLIEPDKRSHGTIPLEARLPSGDSFVVPSNLYIIGTMNTADKSIALLDIALRRRFEFESMYPKYEIKDHVIYDIDILKKINEQIIRSKGHDFQIGHAYFMGDNNDLVERMNKKVIPLLLEYYMNDEKEVKGILNSAGLQIEEGSWPIRITGKYD